MPDDVEANESFSGGGRPSKNGWTYETRSYVFDAINSLRRELTMLINERDKRYTEQGAERDRRYTERSSQQDKAVVDALAAAEKAVNAALVAADKAVEKEQLNAEKWRNNANEWRQAMDDRETRFMGKEEARLTVNAVEARVSKLEAVASKGAGHHEAVTSGAFALYFSIAAIVAVAALIVSIIYH
jgi:hypothetical protein